MDLSGGVAVVTGAASGIGQAIAEKCLSEQMKVVLADVEEDALELAADKLAKRGTVLAVPTDVSVAESVDEQRRQAEALGPVHLVCNNAGVSGAGPGAAWEKADQRLAMGVGGQPVGSHSRHASVPAGDGRARSRPHRQHRIDRWAPSISFRRAMRGEQACRGEHFGVHLPRARDARLECPRLGPLTASDANQTDQMLETMVKQLVDTGMDPALVAEQVLDAVRSERFWVLPNASDFGPAVKDFAASAVEGRDRPMAPMA